MYTYIYLPFYDFLSLYLIEMERWFLFTNFACCFNRFTENQPYIFLFCYSVVAFAAKETWNADVYAVHWCVLNGMELSMLCLYVER